jgi:hypothetical protein
MPRPSLSLKRWALVAAAALLAWAALAAQRRQAQAQALQWQAGRELTAAKAGYEALQASDLQLMGAELDRLAMDPGLRAAYLARDRARLLALARPLYRRLDESDDLTQFNFLDPPPAATCFLRVQAPDQFGDRVEHRSYRQAVENGRAGEDIELDPTAFALRSVRAWRGADGRHVIGYLELGEEIGHFLADLKARSGDDFALFLDKQYLDPLRWMRACHAQGRVSDWSDRPVYVLANDTGVLAKQLQYNGVAADLPLDGKVLGLEAMGARTIMTGVFPVQDALQRPCGVMLVACDVSPVWGLGRAAGWAGDAVALLAMLLLGSWASRRR